MKFLIFALTFLFLNIAGAQLPGTNPSQRMPTAPPEATEAGNTDIAAAQPAQPCCAKNAPDGRLRDNTNPSAAAGLPNTNSSGAGPAQDR